MKKVKKNRDHKLISLVTEDLYKLVIEFSVNNNDISISKAIELLIAEGLKSFGKSVN